MPGFRERQAGLAAKGELVEPLGSETLVHLASALGALVLRITTGPVPSPGSAVHVGARADGLLLFDAATGHALLEAKMATAMA